MPLKKTLIVLTNTALFPWLFYEHGLGLNLFLFNLLIFSGLFLLGKLNLKNSLNRSIAIGTLLSAFFVVFNGSAIAMFANIFSLFLLAGISVFPEGRNLFYVSIISLVNFLTAQNSFFSMLRKQIPKTRGLYKLFRIIKLLFIPLAIPVFNDFVKSFFEALDSFFTWLFKNMEFTLFLTIIFGFLLSNYFFLGKPARSIATQDLNSTDQLLRIRNKYSTKFKITALNSEYKSAIILFALLNVLILVINIIDIWWVWFNFEWNGEYLKQFVHEGTYLLILSILVSLAISIFYFRGNLNFLKNNKVLKYLAYTWLAQNAVLTISVGIRNFWYINYFSLAYLRIGVIFFLLLCFASSNGFLQLGYYYCKV